MSETKKNPAEFGYVGNEVIPFTVADYTNVLQIVDKMLDKETTKDTPLKYKYLNKETGVEIKTVNDKNRNVAVKVVDIEKTLSSDKVLTLTPEGVELLRVKMVLQGIHLTNIETGVAKHYTELEAIANAERAQAAELIAAKDAASEEQPAEETGDVSE